MVFQAANVAFLSKQIQLLQNKVLSSFKVSHPYPTYKEFRNLKKRILAEVGIGVAMKLCFTLSLIFRKPKDPIDFEEKQSLIYQISCRDYDAIYIGKTGRRVKSRKNGTG